MGKVWLSLKRTIKCKLRPSEVHDPKESKQQKNAERKEKLENCSPKLKGRSDILNPITHEVVLDSSNGEISICPCCPFPQSDHRSSKCGEGPHKSTRPNTPSRKSDHVDCIECNISSSPRILSQTDPGYPLSSNCHKCGQKLKNLDAIEAHHISEHSVTELDKEESSRQIIETICQTNWKNSENKSRQKIESVLKVQNTHKTFARFEECREVIKINADKLQKKHPRCLADGNELLRFHGTTLACPLVLNGSSFSCSLCTSDHCGLCQILRHGFSANWEFHGALGVFTTSTSAKALDSIGSSYERPSMRKCVIVCRLVAGRVHSPLKEIKEMDDSGFDSLAGKMNCHSSDYEELYVLNPRALLPCFVVIYKP